MRVLLHLTAGISLAWAVLLLGFTDFVLSPGPPSPAERGLANGLGLANLVFAFVFWYAARAPAANRGALYGAILFAALKTANDLYDLLALVPPERAFLTLGDLVVSVGLLVGLLEALPRTLSATPARR